MALTRQSAPWTDITSASDGTQMHDYYNQAARHAEDVSAWTADAVADLPASGNWPGRSIYVISEKAAYVWNGAGWDPTDGAWVTLTLAANISLLGTTPVRAKHVGAHLVYIEGAISGTSASNYGVATLPVGMRPLEEKSIFADSGVKMQVLSTGAINSTLSGVKTVRFSGLISIA